MDREGDQGIGTPEKQSGAFSGYYHRKLGRDRQVVGDTGSDSGGPRKSAGKKQPDAIH
ncbi:MAG: hypothetical protein GY826_16210 [Fuerstiella sp.]|nr:hypothetical protein [Fuerstiella sp.]